MKKILKNFYLIFILILLYAPIATLIILSFNASKSRAAWGGFTLKWYLELFRNQEIMNALYTTLLVSLAAAGIATLIGTLAALGISGMRQRARTISLGVTNIPMLNSEIVMGVSLMLLFLIGRMRLGFSTILISHITFDIPYVILNVMPKLRQTNRSTYEAALDLGASPFYAFQKTILPDILPGVMTGFLFAFTMSLDDFVITYFTKGPGVDTLSTKIYSEVRKGIKPEIYALSTLMFLSVLLLLLIINLPAGRKKAARPALSADLLQEELQAAAEDTEEPTGALQKLRQSLSPRLFLTRILPVCLVLLLAAGGICFTSGKALPDDREVIVYNWGEYIDPDVLRQFEEETGIHVIYEEFETNEIMYPKIKEGAVAYDLVCPSDYMISKMIQNDLLQKINPEKLPNLKNIGSIYMEMSRQFDPGNQYSVPYCWGTVGILYNKEKITSPVDSWSILWDSRYKDDILMQDSVRDAFMVALKDLGFSANTTNIAELRRAQELLIAQKPLVQAYVIDQVRDKMIGNEAALGVIYSGEALYTQMQNPKLEYVLPKEGSNMWIDSFVMPKNARHRENAYKFLNFLCRGDIALKNFEYITYPTPNTEARKLMKNKSLRDNPIVFPSDEEIRRCETYAYLGARAETLYSDLWNQVKSH